MTAQELLADSIRVGQSLTAGQPSGKRACVRDTLGAGLDTTSEEYDHADSVAAAG